MADLAKPLATVERFSRFARRLLQARPELAEETLERCRVPWTQQQMRQALEACAARDDASLKAALRGLRQRVLLSVMTRDLNGLADLGEVTATMTALAQVCLEFAQAHFEHALQTPYGTPIGAQSGQAQRLIIVGMGKLGGGELNVSSDIDLIFVYPEEGDTQGPRAISNHEFFVLLGKKIIAALHEVSADGFVFRVDMRLRPYGESGALAIGFDALENYFITQGRPWERYAWIKARALTGERHEEFAQLVRPFVFRRYLDFPALASLRELHAQIRTEVQRRDLRNDIKRGPGGIREIEFIGQVFQLIRGGRDTSMQARATRVVLSRLQQLRLLPVAAVDELDTAYVFLRNLEHRLQYLDDAQTQRLPDNPADLDLVAEAMDFASTGQLLEALALHRANVSKHFEAVFALTGANDRAHALSPLLLNTLPPEEATAKLAALGYANPQEVLRRLQIWRAGPRYQQVPESSRARLDALAPVVVESAAAQPNPDATLERMIALLESVSRREAYLALLLENPGTLNKVAKLVAASGWAANYLKQHPIVLDELLDHRELHALPDWRILARSLDEQLTQLAGDTERQMDALRQFKQSQVFRLIAQDLEGLMALEKLSDHLSDLADLLLDATLRAAWHSIAKRHRERPRFAVIGYGKLGGKELGYGSDLDIIFLFDDPAPEAPELYARLAQRLNAWLGAYTGAGVLYQTDLRLRPDGASGLLVSTVAAFEQYQRKQAWTWEHQALTRARYCAGDQEIGARFEAIRVDVLRQRRDVDILRADVAEMRDKMAAGHKVPPHWFDLKHSPGGLVDVEFAVQYLVLAHAHAQPRLSANSGNIALLHACGELGLIPASLAQRCAGSYRELRRLQHRAWLNEEPEARVRPETVASVAAPVAELRELLFKQ
jgi:[glutamine synthetase] adenylyltransferase / [glutamine synthetase]-adenylyl-L-tyrosine phosphorylase